MWNITNLTKEVLINSDICLHWCIEKGLINSTAQCPKCNANMKLYYPTLMWKCCLGGHIKQLSVKHNSWFENSNLKMEQILILTYMFANGLTKYEDIIRETSNLNTLSSRTVADWISFCREICLISLDIDYGNDKIGGIGHIVQVDESKVGKRKYERGRIVEGQWLFGMVDIGNEQNKKFEIRLDLCPENKRNSDVLVSLIKKHVKPGTTIWSDCWAGYNSLTSHGYEHFTVNHSENFVNPKSLVHTQHIECLWRQIKRKLHTGGHKHYLLSEYLCEFLWRKKAKFNNLDTFEAFIESIVRVYQIKI